MRMKKFINEPQNLVPELLEGLALAFPDKVRLVGQQHRRPRHAKGGRQSTAS